VRVGVVGPQDVEREPLRGALPDPGQLAQLGDQALDGRGVQGSITCLEAGQAERVTIATNMAGRGTDIILDDIVTKNGGLHVIATEMHSSKRIDRQLIGRAARQGDLGTYQFFLSLEDELLRCLSPRRRQSAIRRAVADAKGELAPGWLNYFTRTQRFLERMHAKQRRDVLKREQYRTEYSNKMGLDPFLEMTD